MVDVKYYEEIKATAEKDFADLPSKISAVGSDRAKACVNELLERILLKLDASSPPHNLRPLKKQTTQHVLNLCEKVQNFQVDDNTSSTTHTDQQPSLSQSNTKTEVKERRILLVGRTGCEKRWLGNVLLSTTPIFKEGPGPEEYFNINTSLGQGQTMYNECYTRTVLDDVTLTVVDTPAIPCGQLDDGMFNGLGPAKVKSMAINEMQEAVRREKRGYHAIVFVKRSPTQTLKMAPEDEECRKELIKLLGPEVMNYLVEIYIPDQDFKDMLDREARQTRSRFPSDLSFKDIISRHQLSSYVQVDDVRVWVGDDIQRSLLHRVGDLVERNEGVLYTWNMKQSKSFFHKIHFPKIQFSLSPKVQFALELSVLLTMLTVGLFGFLVNLIGFDLDPLNYIKNLLFTFVILFCIIMPGMNVLSYIENLHRH